ncbi:MAG: hypothetical protein M0Q53_16720 [Prolixibacteraceae bacterium]|jgi:hypothetical protein|nr:hypothetical protein [Prolixibacteraceae bacterium]
MGRKPKMGERLETHHLSQKHRELIPKLLHLRKAWTKESPSQILEKIKNKYNVKITDSEVVSTLDSTFSRLDATSNVIDGDLTEETKNAWENMIKGERQFLLNEIASGTAVYESWKFDYMSAKNLIEDICDSENPTQYCLFLNTQLDINQFFLPQIHLHLAVQKSIEQRLNLSCMAQCLAERDKKTKKAKVKACSAFHPNFKNYRILFINNTSVKLNIL